MSNVKSSFYVLPLILLSPIAFNYEKPLGFALFPSQIPLEAPQAVNQALLSASMPHATWSATLGSMPTVSASQDSALATNEALEAKSEVGQKIQKPKYTCPESDGREQDMFFCDHCGGAKDVTPWTDDGEPNAKCTGLSDGMWEGCLCYEEPEQQVFPLERRNVDTRKKGQRGEKGEKSFG